jgi:hypothetical protein
MMFIFAVEYSAAKIMMNNYLLKIIFFSEIYN